MLYQAHLTIPANTLEIAKVETILKLPQGIINKVEVAFPPGCNALAHVQVYIKEHLVFPSSPDDSFAWDNYTEQWAEDFNLNEAPYELAFRGWNLDENYEHTITLRIAMLSNTNSMAAYLQKLIGVQNV